MNTANDNNEVASGGTPGALRTGAADNEKVDFTIRNANAGTATVKLFLNGTTDPDNVFFQAELEFNERIVVIDFKLASTSVIYALSDISDVFWFDGLVAL